MKFAGRCCCKSFMMTFRRCGGGDGVRGGGGGDTDGFLDVRGRGRRTASIAACAFSNARAASSARAAATTASLELAQLLHEPLLELLLVPLPDPQPLLHVLVVFVVAWW